MVECAILVLSVSFLDWDVRWLACLLHETDGRNISGRPHLKTDASNQAPDSQYNMFNIRKRARGNTADHGKRSHTRLEEARHCGWQANNSSPVLSRRRSRMDRTYLVPAAPNISDAEQRGTPPSSFVPDVSKMLGL